MSRKQKLSLEEKVKIILDYLKGNTGICEAAQKGGVGRKTMYQWVRNYQADGVEAFFAAQEPCVQLRNVMRGQRVPFEAACELIHVAHSAYHK